MHWVGDSNTDKFCSRCDKPLVSIFTDIVVNGVTVDVCIVCYHRYRRGAT